MGWCNERVGQQFVSMHQDRDRDEKEVWVPAARQEAIRILPHQALTHTLTHNHHHQYYHMPLSPTSNAFHQIMKQFTSRTNAKRIRRFTAKVIFAAAVLSRFVFTALPLPLMRSAYSTHSTQHIQHSTQHTAHSHQSHTALNQSI